MKELNNALGQNVMSRNLKDVKGGTNGAGLDPTQAQARSVIKLPRVKDNLGG
ncbi:hypothetical protein L1077_21725 [Pseudoalteromonas luteoviolacea]|uniref:hypothetical protein n=1 Tax=Pseudoalteromonas luteoviolacea TaxID=43657 RepID=UPI001F2466B3|nr:hypothetical protein [Pseudoalteromonas luteoviolacea]MCF6442054.1 hypothetical protein [Pseudoalteromonas luteoviolacea]